MCVEVVGALVAVLLAAGADAPAGSATARAASSHDGWELLAALGPSHVPPELVIQALPPPPQTIVRQTSYFGTVTIDHRAHLARRAKCASCHDPGPVTKIVFTPKVAHDRCIGCHQQAARGPTVCKDCHVKPPEPPATVIVKAEEKPAPEKATVPTGPPAGSMAALMLESPPPEPAPPATFQRSLEAGFAIGTVSGISLRLTGRQGRVALEYTFDRLSGGGYNRLISLIGGGVTHRFTDRGEILAVALGGIDALDRPEATIMPALGARVGIAWLPRRNSWLLQSVGLSVTGVADVANRTALRRDVGGTSFYGTFAMGFGQPRR